MEEMEYHSDKIWFWNSSDERKEMKFHRDQQILMMLHQYVKAFIVLGSLGFDET